MSWMLAAEPLCPLPLPPPPLAWEACAMDEEWGDVVVQGRRVD